MAQSKSSASLSAKAINEKGAIASSPSTTTATPKKLPKAYTARKKAKGKKNNTRKKKSEPSDSIQRKLF